jgi:2-polyprenyl-6-methoxyphenol hydroxylase-like FAD-dependent oxidoreductase
MAEHKKADVVVVGAGPVGLFAALTLKAAGVDVRVFDSGRRTAVHSYALVLHGATLDLLDGFGLGAACMGAGRVVTKLGLFEGGSRRGEIDLTRRGGAHPHVLVLPQSRLETVLEDALERKGVKVHWDHRVQALEQGATGVPMTVAKLEKVSTGYPIAHTEVVVDKLFDVEAAYVVAADGYDSFVRRRLGIPQTDMAGGQLYSVFQFEVKGEAPADGRLMLEPGHVGGYWPLPDGRVRFSFPIGVESEHTPDEGRLRELIEQRAPWFTAKAGAIEWTALGLFERKLSTTFGSGRVWFAGDAAHLTGPLGAQSMNVGLREAGDLARKLGAIIRQGGPVSALDAYAASRLAEWNSLLPADAKPAQIRSILLPCLPASGVDLAELLAQVPL